MIFKDARYLLFAMTVAGLVTITSCGGASRVSLSGDLMVWHPVTVSFEGPQTSENATANPFLDYRFDVLFTNGDREYLVPGYFAADGNAANTGADAGAIWQAQFMPDAPGEWRYTAYFWQSPDIALAANPASVDRIEERGSFVVAPSDKPAGDFRRKGLLAYVDERYFKFAGTGEYFIKGGADSPENLLAYTDFDGTFDYDAENGGTGGFLHAYEPHLGDWRQGDPVWGSGRGKALIGMMNYLASKGMNSVYFLTMNVNGDGKDVWPWTGYDERLRFDVSKLAQWDIVFSHMDELGLMMHVVTQETENDHLLDGGELDRERKLYYRELVARFAHHPALVWNLGEENVNSTEQQQAFADYLTTIDPYDHPVVIHTYPEQHEQVYAPLLGYPFINGPSLQVGDQKTVHEITRTWIDRSDSSGHQWVVSLDEIGPYTTGVLPDADDPEHNDVRHFSLWGNLMAGGAGVEWYFGYQYDHTDLNCEDWRSRDIMWDQTRYALEFFRDNLPFTVMASHDSLTASADDYCFALPGEVYAIYLPHGGTTNLDCGDSDGMFTVEWYNPRAGGALQSGTVETITGPGMQSIGQATTDTGKDWVALVKRVERERN